MANTSDGDKGDPPNLPYNVNNNALSPPNSDALSISSSTMSSARNESVLPDVDEVLSLSDPSTSNPDLTNYDDDAIDDVHNDPNSMHDNAEDEAPDAKASLS